MLTGLRDLLGGHATPDAVGDSAILLMLVLVVVAALMFRMLGRRD